MKKLPVFLLATLLCSCDPYGTSRSSEKEIINTLASGGKGASSSTAGNAPVKIAVQANDTKYVSLNGVPKTEANNLITDFEQKTYGKEVPIKQVSVFFKAAAIKKMYEILTKDRKIVSDGGIGQTDGFRIYFVNKDTDRKEFSVILVATKYAGIDPIFNVKAHTDYYHDTTGGNAFPQADFGDKKKGDCDGGARIYTRPQNGENDVDCQIDATHRVSRRFAETMTMRNFGTAAINTKSVWFDYSLLHNLMNSPILKGISGIRIYYGNYGDTDTNERKRNKGDERKGRYTFIIMPTVPGKNAQQRDIDADKIDCNPIKTLWGNIYKSKNDGGYNNGELCPDHCNKTPGGDPGPGILKSSLKKRN